MPALRKKYWDFYNGVQMFIPGWQSYNNTIIIVILFIRTPVRHKVNMIGINISQ